LRGTATPILHRGLCVLDLRPSTDDVFAIVAPDRRLPTPIRVRSRSVRAVDRIRCATVTTRPAPVFQLGRTEAGRSSHPRGVTYDQHLRHPADRRVASVAFSVFGR